MLEKNGSLAVCSHITHVIKEHKVLHSRRGRADVEEVLHDDQAALPVQLYL